MVEQVVRLTVDLTSQRRADGGIQEPCGDDDGGDKASRHVGYEWFASADGKRFRLVETYADAGAIEAHFMGAAVQVHVPKLMACASVTSFEFYGDPGPRSLRWRRDWA